VTQDPPEPRAARDGDRLPWTPGERLRYRRPMRRIALIAVLALAGGCKKESKPEEAGKVVSPGDVRVAILLDGGPVTDVDPGQAGAWAPLGHFLPAEHKEPASWAAIEVHGRAGEPPQTLEDPETRHPGLVPALFPGRHGIAFGFFAPQELARKGKPVWQVDPVTRLALTGRRAAMGGQGGGDGAGGGGENEGERPTPSADLRIEISGPGGESVFTGDRLVDLPTSTAPIGDTDTPGWTLPQILAAAGVRPTGTLVLYGEEGANLILDAQDLDPATRSAFIKLNRSGQLRFRLFKKTGSTWDIAGELRGIARIEVK
jgi:hypothetical protein